MGAWLSQFAIPTNDNYDSNDEENFRWPIRSVSKESVYEYFGVNPVLRTVLRIGLCVVIIAGAAVATVLIIRKKKKKTVQEEIEPTPEET